MTPKRKRELAEKTIAIIYSEPEGVERDTGILEAAFLEIEREVREECAKVCDKNMYRTGDFLAIELRAELKGDGE